jgi:predicted HTH domain antitoxin
MERGITKEGSMTTVTITIPEELSTQLGPYQDKLDELLRIGLSEMKKTQALSLFKKGNISLWRAARLADVSLREMTEYAVSQGLRALPDEETEREEVA